MARTIDPSNDIRADSNPDFQLNERLLRRREDYFHPHTKKMPDQVRISCRPLSKDIDNQRPEGFRGVAAFPQDQRAEHGFDNRADHISLSPLLMESFLRLSQTIVESPDLNPDECRSWDRLFAPPGRPVRSPGGGGREVVEDESALQDRLAQLLRRAFRRPVDPQTLARFTLLTATSPITEKSMPKAFASLRLDCRMVASTSTCAGRESSCVSRYFQAPIASTKNRWLSGW